MPNEGVSKILGGMPPPKILGTPSFGFGFDFDFDWDFDWQSDLFNLGQRVSGLEFRKGLKTKCVSDYRSRHDDQNGPRIVKIGAILPCFWPLQSFQ